MSPVDDRAWYLAGPMTGIPQFNFPAFFAAADELRKRFGLDIISPAEMDDKKYLESTTGLLTPDDPTWGDFLARDVKLIADTCQGIIFLDGWEKSRGARLEAFVGILAGHDFARYVPSSGCERLSPQMVLTMLVKETHREIRNASH